MSDIDSKVATLDPKDAVQLMLAGHTLIDSCGWKYHWDEKNAGFCFKTNSGDELFSTRDFFGLRPYSGDPVKKRETRPATRWEWINWANSPASVGWVVKHEADSTWCPPQSFAFRLFEPEEYRRARLLSDLSGVDENTIGMFMVEVEESNANHI